MPRLITLLVLLPWVATAMPPAASAQSSPSPKEKTLDLSVSPEERALRDLIPDWEPVRPLTEDEIARPDSPFLMLMGGFPRTNLKVVIPTIPPSWTAGWPEPGPLLAIDVPRGWWWKPKDPKFFGGWLVLAKNQTSQPFFAMVTQPLRMVDYGSLPSEEAMQAIYRALRDREARRRGVDPAVLDREAKQLEADSGYISILQQARLASYRLNREDKLDEAIDLLSRVIDENSGTAVDQFMAMASLGELHYASGEMTQARAFFRQAREQAFDSGYTSSLAPFDDQIATIDELLTDWSPPMQIAMRGLSSFERGNLPAARQRFEQALTMFKESDDPGTALTIRYRLALIYERTGDPTAARAEAKRALALEAEVGNAEQAAEMRALLARLDAADGRQSSP